MKRFYYLFRKNNFQCVKIIRHGFTKRLYLKRIFMTFIETLLLKFYPPFRTKFNDGIVKDGIDELLIPKENPTMKKINGVWVEDEDAEKYHSVWVARW